MIKIICLRAYAANPLHGRATVGPREGFKEQLHPLKDSLP